MKTQTRADSEIQTGIEQYIHARKKILKLRERYPHRFGVNDNIIGRIGEFIALRFLEKQGQNPKKVLNPSNEGFDLVEKAI